MSLTLLNKFNGFISQHKISDLLSAGGACGKLLLLRPLLYAIFSRQRDVSLYASVDTSAMVFIVYAVLCMAFGLHEILKHSLCRQMLFRSSLVMFLLYTLYGFVTMFWSVNVALTGFRAFECLAMMLLMIAVVGRLLSTHDKQLLINWTFLFVFWSAIISIIKSFGYATSILDILGSNQQFVPLFFYLSLFRSKHRLVDLLVFGLAIFSFSTVAYIGMAIGLLSTLRGSLRMRVAALLMFMMIAVVALWVGPEQLLKDTLFFDKTEISMEETSGRDYLMDATIECIQENPKGLGFFAGEPYYLYERFTGAINAHNSFFSAMIGCGYVGLVLMVLFFLAAFRNVVSRRIDREYRPMLFGSFCIVLVECLGNPSIGSRVYGAWVGEMFILCMIAGLYCYGKFNHQDNTQLL